MKTSLDIPERELKDVLRFTKAKTKKDAIITAVREYNQRQRIIALSKHAGKSKTFMTLDELMKMRRAG